MIKVKCECGTTTYIKNVKLTVDEEKERFTGIAIVCPNHECKKKLLFTLVDLDKQEIKVKSKVCDAYLTERHCDIPEETKANFKWFCETCISGLYGWENYCSFCGSKIDEWER